MKDSTLKRTPYDWILEILSWIAALFALVPLIGYSRIASEASVPTHYDFSGAVTAWGNKEYLLGYSLLAIFFFLLLLFLERNYKKLNYPIKVAQNNRSALYRLGVELVRHLKLILVCLFSYLANLSYSVAAGRSCGGQAPIIVILALLLISLGYFFVKMFKLKKLQ